MSDLNTDILLLDVPYFQQTHLATCGSAALMMVMKYWDSSFKLSNKVEFQLWKKSNSLLFKGGVLQFGLAKAAVEMGFKTKIYQTARLSEYYSTFHMLFDFLEDIVSFDVRSAKVPIHYGRKVLDVIHEALVKKIPPLVFLNLEPILGENVFHWIVVTGMDGQKVYVNDPYIPEGSMLKTKKGYPINLESFENAIATDLYTNMSFPYSLLHLPPCTVLVYK